jgi:cyclopropane fatty-acyl-phospholipid synthase-like methyltransferase
VNPGGVRGRDLLLAALNPRPGSRVLEIGCGTGHTAVHLARRWRCQVHAVDIAPEMVEATRRAAQAAGVAARI